MSLNLTLHYSCLPSYIHFASLLGQCSIVKRLMITCFFIWFLSRSSDFFFIECFQTSSSALRVLTPTLFHLFGWWWNRLFSVTVKYFHPFGIHLVGVKNIVSSSRTPSLHIIFWQKGPVISLIFFLRWFWVMKPSSVLLKFNLIGETFVVISVGLCVKVCMLIWFFTLSTSKVAWWLIFICEEVERSFRNYFCEPSFFRCFYFYHKMFEAVSSEL